MERYWFGPPDAASAELDLDKLAELYLNIDGALDSSRDQAMPRVLFGRKGSGKSHYLRALNALKAGDPSVLAFGPSTSPPPNDWVIRLSIALGAQAIPTWGELWRKAILASAAATLLYDIGGREHDAGIRALHAERLEQAARAVLGASQVGHTPMSPFTAADHILTRAKDLERFRALLARSQWQDLEEHLEPIVASSPSLYFFLDNLDAVEPFAPRPWAACQRGLLDAILALGEDSRFRHIHVVVALRDTVVQPLFDSVHGAKYVHSPMLRRLAWNAEQSQEFLRRKVAALPVTNDEPSPGARRTSDWLSRTTIANTVRGCEEDVEAYLLRHTLLLPRDVVEMGNSLCDALERAFKRGANSLSDDEVKAAVNRAARQIGKTGIYGAGIEVARRLMPSDAPLHGASESYGLAGDEAARRHEDDMTGAISDHYTGLLTDAVKKIRQDRFETDALARMESSIRGSLAQPNSVKEACGALWRLGMVGVIDGALESGEVTFYGRSEHDDTQLPRSARRLAFHPSMIDYLGEAHVRAVGEPVYPEPGFLAALGVI
jgi:hypothetical protein